MLYLLHGADTFRAETFLKEKMPSDADVTVLRGDELKAETLLGAGEALPMFGQERWIVVRGYPSVSSLPYLEALAKNGASTLRLTIVVSDELKEDDRLLKLARQHGEVHLFRPLKKPDVIMWIRRRAVEVGLQMDAEVAELIWEVAGSDLAMASSELEKLVSYAAGKKLSRREAEEVVGHSAQERLWALFDALKLQDQTKALSALHRLLSQGMEPAQVMAGLASYFRRILVASELRSSDEELAKAIEVLERRAGNRVTVESWRATSYRQHASSVSRERLHRQYIMLAVADEMLKSTSFPPDLLLDIMVCDLAGGPEGQLEELLESYR